MARLKEMMTEAHVHQRKLEMKTHPLDDGRIIVEGQLKDDRMVDGYHWDGRKRPPGIIHHMIVRLLVGGWPLTIQEAEVEMPGIPQEFCLETMESVQAVVGVPIVSGYSDEIRRRIGGIKGCAHLAHLLVVMGPAALHGFWTSASRTPRPVPKSMDEIPGISLLKNTCWVWREGGPFLERIKEVVESGHTPEGN